MPLTGTEAFEPRQRWKPWDARCGICGEYGGFIHARCWWVWLTAERVIRGASDGEQQIEPDEDYPSRLVMFWRYTRTLFDPSWWAPCWRERRNPWPYGQMMPPTRSAEGVGRPIDQGSKSVGSLPTPVRRCVVCLTPVEGAYRLYCDPHRLEARRTSARLYKRRVQGYKGIEA